MRVRGHSPGPQNQVALMPPARRFPRSPVLEDLRHPPKGGIAPAQPPIKGGTSLRRLRVSAPFAGASRGAS